MAAVWTGALRAVRLRHLRDRTARLNHPYYGDNLAVLRAHVASGSVDLIFLDPPFNSNASHNVLFRGPNGDESRAPGLDRRGVGWT